ncbi:26S proteasome non-ATPase regulatory subunit 12 [Phytophthora nicotianae]|uniref:26S proteasome non-ATPase regulatory subunit 12 n=1 Tax=Phytophthora nicotianae TaxID=4792 RepID=A0A0W8CNQ7_PHYNI|nr:26S proteasome non-ATPase regulatory subunit 12 [Phytophthora nicotianae]
MFSQKLDGEGYQTCTALVLLIQHGKTNTFGKMQHVGYMRNKDVRICPVGAAAFYFFHLFHVDREPFPSFAKSQDWYDLKFLRGRQRTKAITYDTHKKSYEPCSSIWVYHLTKNAYQSSAGSAAARVR